MKFESLPDKVYGILTDAGRIADDIGYNIYVVGGFVRDLILGVENLDIDLVVEGDAIHFADKFSEKYSAKLETYEKFRTALVTLENDFTIDIVTARKEKYTHPAALPEVCKGTVRDDLQRRDFTINSMAIRLNSRDWGTIIDFFDGQKDLSMGIVRVHHDLSFIDDPTRIIRAVRFEIRYGFHMDEKTEHLAVEAIESGVFDAVSRERIGFEFDILLKEKNFAGILKRMLNLGILEKIYPEIELTDKTLEIIENIDNNVSLLQKNLQFNENIDKILLYILLLHYNMDGEKVPGSVSKMRLERDFKRELTSLINTRDKSLPMLLSKEGASNYDIYLAFKDASIEVLAALYFMNESHVVHEGILKYLNSLRCIKPCITGKDLIKLGIRPGPEFGEILQGILREKVNGKINTFEDELEYVNKFRMSRKT